MIFCLYLRTGTIVQETKQSWNLVNSLPELKVLVTFFPYCIKEWNKLDTKIKNLPSLSTFKKALLVLCKTEEHSLFNVHNPIGGKYLNRLRVNLSHLNEHKFHHNFRDTVNSLFCCNTETETTSHCLALPFVF